MAPRPSQGLIRLVKDTWRQAGAKQARIGFQATPTAQYCWVLPPNPWVLRWTVSGRMRSIRTAGALLPSGATAAAIRPRAGGQGDRLPRLTCRVTPTQIERRRDHRES